MRISNLQGLGLGLRSWALRGAVALLALATGCESVSTDDGEDDLDADGDGRGFADDVVGDDSEVREQPGVQVDLGSAASFVILAKTAIATVPGSAITGDLGLSPAAATYITGFSLIADSSHVFSTSSQVTGQVLAADYAVPTPSALTTAVSDMQAAFADAAGRLPDVTGLGAGDISGRTLRAGTYGWGTGLLIASDVTLEGGASEVWILQVAQDLTIGNGVTVHLTGGALPQNVFWQVSGGVTLGTTAHAEGVFLGQTAITLATGASVHGRLLAQTSVDVDSSTVVEPAP